MKAWDKLPIRHGEESANFSRLYAKYGKGCPGCHFEDNCMSPYECALKGMCRIVFESHGATKDGAGGLV